MIHFGFFLNFGTGEMEPKANRLIMINSNEPGNSSETLCELATPRAKVFLNVRLHLYESTVTAKILSSRFLLNSK